MRFSRLFWCFSVFCIGCSGARSVLDVKTLPNYDKTAPEHIVFLNFKITEGSKTGSEQVELMNAMAGSGKMKNLSGGHVVYPSYIKAVKSYVDGRQVEFLYEHPLIKQIEVSTPDGQISKVVETAREGILSIRFQEEKLLKKMELHSVRPGRAVRKIYSLTF